MGAEPHTDLRVWLRLLACSTLIENRVRRGLRTEFATTLSRRLMVSNGNVTGIVDRLVVEDLVARRAEASDRRSQRVRLTVAGKRAFDAMTPVHEAWIEDALASLNPTDKTHLLDVLGTLRSTLTSDEARP